MGRWATGIALLVLGLNVGCDEPDPRFASPEATIDSLLESHGLGGLSAKQLRTRLRARDRDRRIRVENQDLLGRCFVRWSGSATDQGLAGFVVGAVASSRDQLRTTIRDESATVTAPGRARITLKLTDDGWKIDLPRSVPRDYRLRMYQLARRVRERNLRQGLPSDF